MIGMIVAGHGSYAAGITSGLKLLAGEPEYYEPVDFLEEDSLEILTGKLAAAAERLSQCTGILIYTDLTGGSPFNVSVRMKMERSGKIAVIGGANLPAVLEGYMSRGSLDSASELAAGSLTAGKNAMVQFEESAVADGDYEE
ncbi:MAG TPA: PTS fructose transporter subunit IIA [Lachnoclostridium sp.]|uniref:PTS system N-acetylgalactosamine-specific IIA component n=1 Tax=[Clostridium] celerecrescens 18A TaxID=1286362 RepID=A0A2M8Z3Q2_9FIRM|nr:PTS fructose transporter subunit IIA [Lacrimispora celerecrescens]PJJ28088.1 PTS system N-acetylgalactosamine-specific IIA component [[Clostridium] celerecrescens 18A]HBE85519.1 PTS fructose transporter subunit IIA [Lachnoclostridium sp.]